MLPYDHPDYPRLLRDLPDPPLVLYVDGTVPDWNRQLTLGIVGTRQASAYAVQVCDIMAKGVAGAGALWSAAAHWESTVPPIRRDVGRRHHRCGAGLRPGYPIFDAK